MSWYPDPERGPVRAGRGRLSLPPQHHHRVHVHRADAQRREPELRRTFSYQHKQVNGHIFAFFVMVVAAAEAAVGLAIILTVFKNRADLEHR
jgi:hypothetical protein